MRVFVITLRDNKTGESKDFIHKSDTLYDSEEEELALIEYMWTDGNYGCDCNKYDNFYPDEDVDYPCHSPEFKDNRRFEVTSIKRKE